MWRLLHTATYSTLKISERWVKLEFLGFSPQDESVYKAELELIKTNPKMDLSSRADRKRGPRERISYT